MTATLEIGFLLFPRLTQLDLTGAYAASVVALYFHGTA